MQQMRITILAIIPALVLMGCGGGSGDKPAPSGGPGPVTTGGGDKTALEVTGVGTIKGRVVYEGTPPKGVDLMPQVEKNEKDAPHCKSDETKNSVTDLTWVVGKDGGVANVAVWVRPPTGKFFKKPADDKKTYKDEVDVNQPFCAFVPHVTVLYSETVDEKTKKLVPTGQKFKFINGAPMAHNTKWAGSEVLQIGGNVNLQPKSEHPLALKSDYNQVIRLNCDFHTWMKGYIWALETPYAAVTDKDGNFTIENVPAGAELFIVPWHEQALFFWTNGAKGDKVTVKAGETTQLPDIKVKAK